jgi:8-amino-7-oxononanoate synthase
MTEGRKGGIFGLPGAVKDELIRRALNRQVPSAGDTTALSGRSTSSVPEAFTRWDRHPGYEKLLVPQAAARRFGVENPYFREHDGVAGATTRIGGREYINFANYNYLGLNGHPRVTRAARDALDRYGSSVSASRLASGERAVQRELEQALAAMHGVDAAVVMVSGHATNVTTLAALLGPRDLVVHDALIHNSVLQGVQLAGAHRRSFPHNDWQALDALLAEIRGQHERAIVVIEGIYSMDGDLPDLPRFIDIKRRHRAFLMVDEAHSIGVLGTHGRGIGEHFGIDGRDVDIWMGTLSKSLAACGGYIAGDRALVENLKYSAGGFVYSVGIAPPVAAAALESVQLMQAEPERVATLRERGRMFLELARQRRINTGTSAGHAVIPAITGSSLKAARTAQALFARGINVQPIIYPAVEESSARLRFFMSCGHTGEQVRYTVDALAEVLGT